MPIKIDTPAGGSGGENKCGADGTGSADDSDGIGGLVLEKPDRDSDHT